MKAVHIYFLFFALSFFANYLAYYKRSILYAEQNNRISIMSTTISQVIFRGMAIVSAVLTHEYLYFLLFLIGEREFEPLFVQIAFHVVAQSYPVII